MQKKISRGAHRTTPARGVAEDEVHTSPIIPQTYSCKTYCHEAHVVVHPRGVAESEVHTAEDVNKALNSCKKFVYSANEK